MSRWALAWLVMCAACAPAPRGPSYGRAEDIPNAFPSELRVPTKSDHIAIYAALHETTLDPLTAAGKLASIGVRSVWDVPMVLEECGDPNATYDPTSRSIRVCYELITYANQLRGRPAYTIDDDVRLWMLFATLHEIGHALIDQFDLPTRGVSDGEDLADQYAALAIANGGGDPRTLVRLLPAVTFFVKHGERQHSNDEHRDGDARAEDIMCIAIANARLTADPQPSGCTTLAEAAAARWNRLLAPHSRIDTGKTF